MSRKCVLRPRGGRNSGKHAEMVIFNPTPGTPICRGSELHLWSELLPLIVKLYSLGLAQDSKHARASAAPRRNATVRPEMPENGPKMARKMTIFEQIFGPEKKRKGFPSIG